MPAALPLPYSETALCIIISDLSVDRIFTAVVLTVVIEVCFYLRFNTIFSTMEVYCGFLRPQRLKGLSDHCHTNFIDSVRHGL